MGAPSGWCWSLFILWPPQTQYLAVHKQRAWPATGNSAVPWVAHLTWVATLQRPVGTGFIQYWSGLPGLAVPSALPWGVAGGGRHCQPGPLPAGNHRGHWKQRPGCSHMHTHGHDADTTSDTYALTDTRGPQDYGKAPGPAAVLLLLWAGSLRKVCSERTRLLSSGTGRGSHSSARHHSRGDTHPPQADEATDGTVMMREKTEEVENPKLQSPQRNT